jgi:flagellar biosynthesis protein FliR
VLGFQVGSLQQGLSVEQSSDYRKLFFVISLFFWFGISGHRILVEGLLRSFEYFEVGQFHFSLETMHLLNQMISLCLEFSIRFSLPIVCVGILGFLVTGFSSKLFASQTTSMAFVVNQLLFFLILGPLVVLYSEEVYLQTVSQVENLLTSLTDLNLNGGGV